MWGWVQKKVFNSQTKKASVFAIENPQTCKPVKFVDFCAALPQSGTELSVNGTKSGKIGHRQSIPLRLSLSPSAALFIAPPHVTQLCYGLLEAGILTKTAANICNSPTAGGGDQTWFYFLENFGSKPNVEDGRQGKIWKGRYCWLEKWKQIDIGLQKNIICISLSNGRTLFH